MCLQGLEDDEMMRQYAALLHRQDTAREAALLALQARTALRAEVAGAEVSKTRKRKDYTVRRCKSCQKCCLLFKS